MSSFQSQITINRPVAAVYQFLADFNNHQQLMPDNIQSWTSSYNEAAFGIQNMVQLSLKITERTENSAIKIEATGTPPFSVTLAWAMQANGNDTEVTFTINAELNMMMKMMASGPLQKLANHQVDQLAAILKA